jgi:hypothetical protein
VTPVTLILLATIAQQPVALPEHDRVRLAEVRRLATRILDRVWPGWGATPMPILLVTDSVEYLVGLERPGPGFSRGAYDSLLRTSVWTRRQVLDPKLLATFPAVAGTPTIVVGSAERTGKSATSWVLTVLHEHFHQMQYLRPGYYEAVGRLGLARGDTTGSWMLDYPFPYDSAPVRDSLRGFARSLAGALSDGDGRAAAIEKVRAAWEGLRGALPPADFRYLEFQLWQEGVARYIELAAAGAASQEGDPSEAFRRLPGYEPYASAAARARRTLLAELEKLSPGTDRRVSFYPLGAGLALVLDTAHPEWKTTYFTQPFQLGSLLAGTP